MSHQRYLGILTQIGRLILAKWRKRLLAGTTHFDLAKQMRKQGIPFDAALLILCFSTERFTHLHQGASK